MNSELLKEEHRFAVFFAWLFAIVGSVIGFAAVRAAILAGRPCDIAPWFSLIFPAIAVGLLVFAIYLTARRIKFGRSVLVLETLPPGCVGGWLAGTIQTSKPIGCDTLNLSLRCIRRTTTGSGKHKHTTETVLWEHVQVLTGKLPVAERGGSAIPASFEIAADASPTEHIGPRDRIFWRLRAYAEVPGANYSAEFEVPVHRDKATQRAGYVPAIEATAASLRGATPSQSRRPDDMRIRFISGPGEQKKFNFPARRHAGSAVFLAVVAMAFVGLGCLVQRVDGPMWIVVSLEVFGAIIAWGAMNLGLSDIELTISPAGMEIHRRMLGMSRVRTLPVETVSGINRSNNTTIGDRRYFCIRAALRDGGLKDLASGMSLRDAEWIAGEIGRTLKVPYADEG